MSTESDIWGAAKGILGVVAPMLATAVGGPLAGTATRAIMSALGLSGDTTAEATALAVQNATPDQIAALKKADNDFRVQMRQLGIAEEQLAFQDIASARQRQVGVKDSTPAVLAYALTVGFFGLLALMAFRDMPAGNSALLNVMLGGLGTAWAGAMTFFFGSSQHAADQSQMLFQSTPPASAG